MDRKVSADRVQTGSGELFYRAVLLHNEVVNHFTLSCIRKEYDRLMDDRRVLPLYGWLGALLCGFCWELWNFHACPKWVYQVPCVDCWHVFEMPLLGYGGYLPFSMELFVLYHMVIWLVRPGQKGDYLQLV